MQIKNVFAYTLFMLSLLTGIVCLAMTHENQATQPALQLVPRDIVDGLLNKTYSEEEKNLITLDLTTIKNTCFYNTHAATEQPIYVATAGGPGSCKSTILETYLKDKTNFVYADPDQRALKFMVNTYQQSLSCYQISKKDSYETTLKDAYSKWRDASNYITNTVINEAFDKGYNIAHGTTSTAPIMGSFYKKLKQKNYKIILLLCYAEDEARLKALDHRAKSQALIQVSPEDVVNKGKMFPERFPVYFEYADEIHLYWTNDFKQGSIHAGTYTKETGLTVHNVDAISVFTQKYEHDRKNTQLPTFDELTKKKLS